MIKSNCQFADEHGFCKLYSNDAVVWKCKEDTDCERYVEADESAEQGTE